LHILRKSARLIFMATNHDTNENTNQQAEDARATAFRHAEAAQQHNDAGNVAEAAVEWARAQAAVEAWFATQR